MNMPIEIPKWADVSLVPVLAVIVAFLIAGLVVLGIGENPVKATSLLIKGALGSGEGVGYTLYYATNFIFTGLAVAIAFHAGLFNIGGEGQATMGGFGVALVCLNLDFLPWYIVLPLAILGAMAMGALWAFIPGYLQVRRGSHVVITTIMFNFLAATLVVYMLVNVIGKPGSMSPETRVFAAAAHLPYMHEALAFFGIKIPKSPLNLSFIFALLASAFVWILVWHTRLGYAIRTVGHNPSAATYAGISIGRMTLITMTMSGAFAGLLAVNEILGVQNRLLLEFSSGYGFIGIAVALMGRAHPVGIILASILFGMLYQGGTELSFEMPRVTRDMIVAISGLVILFAGALEGLIRRPVAGAFAHLLKEGPKAMDVFATLIAILESSIRLCVPLVFACLAGLWSEKSGVVDIGLEGKMLVAAFASAAAAGAMNSAVIGLGAGIVAAILFALIHGFASISQRGNQIVSGVAINMLAAGLTALIGNAWYNQGGRTTPLEGDARFLPLSWPGADMSETIPFIGPVYAHLISGHSALVYCALGATIASGFVLRHTRFGLRIRAVGENPAAVDTAGISVTRLRYSAVIIAGVLCGFAGSYLSLGQAAGFLTNMTAGKGFIALAALIFAKWRAWPALWTCFLFGLLDAIAIRLQGVIVPGIGQIPVQAIQALPYLMTVILLAGFIGKAIPPKASGLPYVKER